MTMDWLTADLVLKTIGMMAVIWVVAWISGSLVFWLCCDEGRREVRRRWRVWRLNRGSQFSPTWTRQQQQQESRIEFHGPRIAWPIRKERL